MKSPPRPFAYPYLPRTLLILVVLVSFVFTPMTPLSARSPKQNVEEVKNRLQDQRVGGYFSKTLHTGRIDPSEAAAFRRDIEDLAQAYRTLGVPYSKEFMKWWESRELTKPDLSVIQKTQDFSLELLMVSRLLEYQESLGKNDPLYMMRFLTDFVASEAVRRALSASLWYLLVGVGIGFCSTVVGSIVYSFFGHLAGPIAGKAGVFGARIWRRPSIALQKVLNIQAANPGAASWAIVDEQPTLEKDGLEFPNMSASDVRGTMAFFIDMWAESNNARNRIFTGEIASGRQLVSEALHWRESHLSLVITTFLNEITGYENLIETRISRILAELPSSDRPTIERLFEQLRDANAENWESQIEQKPRSEANQRIHQVIKELQSLNVASSDIQYVLEKNNSQLLAGEKISAGLSLQTVQDLMYPEYNRALTDKVRTMQRVIRSKYRIQPLMQRYRRQIVRNLRNMGVRVTGITEASLDIEMPLEGSKLAGVLFRRPSAEGVRLGIRTPNNQEVPIEWNDTNKADQLINKPVIADGSWSGGIFQVQEMEAFRSPHLTPVYRSSENRGVRVERDPLDQFELFNEDGEPEFKTRPPRVEFPP